MLELRPSCERCAKPLAANAPDAVICSYECTFCRTCATTALQNVCPNCGGNFESRPIRTREKLAQDPASTQPHVAVVDQITHADLVARYGATPPNER